MAKLMTGNLCDVTAQNDADFYSAVIGNARIVFPLGKQFLCEIIDNNNIRVYDGVLLSQGRRIQVESGLYDNFNIPSGSQGVTAYYIIGYHIYTSDGKEQCETFVQKVDSADAVIEEASLRDGNSETYISMYRVTLSGLTITTIVPLFYTIGRTMIDLVNRIHFGTAAPTNDIGNDGDIYIRIIPE